jgi:hypothetical protein
MKLIVICAICLCLFVGIAYADVSITTITPANAISIKPISNDGTVATDSIDASQLSVDTPSMVSIDVEGDMASQSRTMGVRSMQTDITPPPVKTITAQLYPLANVLVSDDGNTIMQTTDGTNSPQLEIYYGYQQDDYHPWSQYYKVDGDITTHADFTTRRVWTTPTDHATIDAIVANGEIPSWSDLP